MSVEELKAVIDGSSEEERLFLAAYLRIKNTGGPGPLGINYLFLQLKTISFLIMAVILAGPFTINGFAQNEPSKINIYTVFEKIRATDFVKVVGMERISPIGAQDSISVSPTLLTALEKVDLSTLSHLIAEDTGYECLSDKDYFAIVPKDDPAKHELALSKHEIVVSSVDKASFDDMYKLVDKLNPSILIGGPLNRPDMGGGAVTLKRGKYRCYNLLNEMALQSGAKYWTIEHLDAYNQLTGKLFFPIILSSGSVSFFRHNL